MGMSQPFLKILDFKTKLIRRLKHIHEKLKASYEKTGV